MSNFKLPLPEEVKEALEKLTDAGHEAWLVGGVRDLILRREVHDWDLTTSATPEEIKQIFSQYHLNCVGEKYGTVCVHYGSLFLDITTFRKEGKYQDHRHPEKVQFTKDLFDDLKRRDFTINAIVYHPEKGFRDFFCGKRDLKKRWIRAIGNADARFEQDAVRILRALRFAAVLGFDIEEKTKEAIHRKKELLLTIAPERVLPEFVRMLCGRNIRYVLTEFADVIGVLIPEILPTIGFCQHSPFHQYDVWQHTVHAVAYADPIPEIRLTLLFHDISKPACLTFDETGRGHFYSHPKKSAVIAKAVMERMKFPVRQTELVTLLVHHHDSHPANRSDVKKLLCQIGEENLPQLLKVMRADTLSHSKWTIKKRLLQVEKLKEIGENILSTGECYNLKGLAIKGDDLSARGVRGERIGELLRICLQNVISEQWENKKEILLYELEKNNW
ncbi:MAG: HD domain-containing protein [Clostridia bacterium]|nr:HD domain-containing protein [Clostridia bacterium]